MSEKPCCGFSVKMIYACSGASDTGEITDRAARQIRDDKIGYMSCLAGIGGGVDDLIEKAQAASKILVIDGCETDCGKKTFEKAGFDHFVHLRLNDLGLKKGETPVTDSRIQMVAEEGKKLLASQTIS
ncbi:MAG: zinc-binding protein [Candidatus Omnitrophota bacterium]|jgi:uncharacterized metal-binding protein|nr:MAG: zinc-binding protein [Candidatus Omnitrophota bacterium]